MTLSRGRICLVIFVLALAVRLILLFGFHLYQISRTEILRSAISLAQRGSFADPYAVPTGPTAHNSPVYPAILAPLYAILGDRPAADWARFVLNALLAAASYALIPLVAEECGLGFRAGAFAALAGALVPLHHWIECVTDGEYVCVALYLEVALLLFARFVKNPSWNGRTGAAAGLLAGFGVLLSPMLAPVLAGLALLTLLRTRPHTRQALPCLAAAAVAALAIPAPWLVRNRVQLGGWSFVRDNLGLELSLANHDGASPTLADNFRNPPPGAAHPFANLATALQVKQMGELAFERMRFHQAVAWMASHPRAFASLTMRRSWQFWFPVVPRFTWAFWMVAVAAAGGLLLLWFRQPWPATVLTAVLVLYALPYSAFGASVRYGHPVWWLLILLAGWLAYTLGAAIYPSVFA